jgi:predicted nucleotidyltransferase
MKMEQMVNAIITENINKIKTLCELHKVKELYVFGSAVSAQFNATSDIDLLYRFDTNNIKDYFINFFEFKESFEKLTNRKVDLIPYENMMNNYFADSIEKSKVKLYEA